ncbi:hypothetical protein [Streptomyces sp. SID13588]|uniref:hypothetical protein n=1 Tax=Streptomyces sp. SID13588 TaxID=2706051 RepID=UPI0013CCDEC4|nr:hypothetical protein [Streptomyces sp. SID13588]NEA73205.1 hypothetical protein [Streptomyces sp. SID13588]
MTRSVVDRPRHRRPPCPSSDGRTAGALLMLLNVLGAPVVAVLLVCGHPDAPPAPSLAVAAPDTPPPSL